MVITHKYLKDIEMEQLDLQRGTVIFLCHQYKRLRRRAPMSTPEKVKRFISPVGGRPCLHQLQDLYINAVIS